MNAHERFSQPSETIRFVEDSVRSAKRLIEDGFATQLEIVAAFDALKSGFRWDDCHSDAELDAYESAKDVFRMVVEKDL